MIIFYGGRSTKLTLTFHGEHEEIALALYELVVQPAYILLF